MGHGDRLPPGTVADDFWTKLRSGLWRLGFELSAEGKKRFFHEFLPLLHDTKYEIMGDEDNDSWYLVYIGTKIESRGRKYAKALVNDIKKQVRQTTGLCGGFDSASTEEYLLIFSRNRRKSSHSIRRRTQQATLFTSKAATVATPLFTWQWASRW